MRLPPCLIPFILAAALSGCGGKSEDTPSPVAPQPDSSTRDAIGNPLPTEEADRDAPSAQPPQELASLLEAELTPGGPLFFPRGSNVLAPLIAPYGEHLLVTGRSFDATELDVDAAKDEDQFFVLRINENLEPAAFKTYDLTAPRTIAAAPDGGAAVALHVWEDFTLEDQQYPVERDFGRPVVVRFDTNLDISHSFQAPDLGADAFPLQLLFDGQDALYVLNDVDGSEVHERRRWLAKYEEGSLMWSQAFEGRWFSGDGEVAILPNGNLAVAGAFGDGLVIDDIHFENEGLTDSFVVVLSPETGQVLHSLQLKSDRNLIIETVTTTAEGNIRVGGELEGRFVMDDEVLESGVLPSALLLELSSTLTLRSAWSSDAFHSVLSMNTSQNDVSYFYGKTGGEQLGSTSYAGLRGVFANGEADLQGEFVQNGDVRSVRVSNDGAFWVISDFDQSVLTINGKSYPSPPSISDGGYALFRFAPAD